MRTVIFRRRKEDSCQLLKQIVFLMLLMIMNYKVEIFRNTER